MEKRKIIIDCDPGIDDSYAIVSALREPSFDVLGIHTVSGNVSVEHTTRNTQGLVKLLGKNVPIYKGANRPLAIEPIFADEVHGHNGFAGYVFPDEQLSSISNLTSLEGYYQTLSTITEKVTIVALGPLTNVALLIKSYPELISKIECISLMGGGLKGGNITIAGEFNFYVDPHAAKIVFQSGIPIIMAGLDVTEKAKFYESDVEQLKSLSDPVCNVLAEISKPGLVRNNGFITPNDAVSVIVLLYPELFKSSELEVHVFLEGEARGLTIANALMREQKKPNAKVLLEVDEIQFREKLLKHVRGV